MSRLGTLGLGAGPVPGVRFLLLVSLRGPGALGAVEVPGVGVGGLCQVRSGMCPGRVSAAAGLGGRGGGAAAREASELPRLCPPRSRDRSPG